jgi:hypothetical protein
MLSSLLQEAVLREIKLTTPGSLNETLASHLVYSYLYPQLGNKMGIRIIKPPRLFAIDIRKYSQYLGLGQLVVENVTSYSYWFERYFQSIDGKWRYYLLKNGTFKYINKKSIFLSNKPTRVKRDVRGVYLHIIHSVMGSLTHWSKEEYLNY